VGGSLEKRLEICQASIRGLRELGRELPLTRAERSALNQAVSSLQFWELGYSLYWQNDRQEEALAVFGESLQRWPWSAKCWKTFLIAWVRTAMRSRKCIGSTTGHSPSPPRSLL
jgi:hypothetical protein